ncbi:DUF6339 family protein [Actinomycetospora sp. OC33-EN08]|uniref:DUF6339 family protein n=1 Tax=Actinomycetospora aurantiaca TaxID=3129233 RepID=A0ABU8MIH1_9PSEU
MSSILYPRLLDGAASELHYRYCRMSIDDLGRHAAFSHPSAIFAATGGQRVPGEHLRELRGQIIEFAIQTGFPTPSGDHAVFDRQVAQLLHERCGLVAAEAAVRSIWAFLALVVLPDVSYWRYPRPPEERILATDITRHVWGRLWWRSHLLVLPEAYGDRYRLLGVLGESDFDQIYARRSLLGGSRTLIRALVDTWPSIDRGGLPSRLVLRDLLKRLLRAGALVEFDALDIGELTAQLRWEATQSVAELKRLG